MTGTTFLFFKGDGFFDGAFDAAGRFHLCGGDGALDRGGRGERDLVRDRSCRVCKVIFLPQDFFGELDVRLAILSGVEELDDTCDDGKDSDSDGGLRGLFLFSASTIYGLTGDDVLDLSSFARGVADDVDLSIGETPGLVPSSVTSASKS